MKKSIRQNFVWWPGLLVLGLSLGLVPLIYAQAAPVIDFQRIITNQIISEVEICDIVQDQQGFLWIGTRSDGLFRYDGYSFMPYIHDPQQSASLTRNEIYSLFLDRAGQLWISLDGGGLERFDPQINGFIHYRHDPQNPASLSSNTVRRVWEDQMGQLWIGTRLGGVNVLDPVTGIFTHYRHDPNNPNSLCTDTVSGGMQDSAGNIWLTTGKGLERFDPSTRGFIHQMLVPEKTQLIGINTIYTLAEDRAGYLWIGTETGGLYRYDRATGNFKIYHHNPSQPASLGSNRISQLLVDSLGVLWVGLNEDGLDRYDGTTDSFTHCRKNRQDARSLPHNTVNALFEDRLGILWVGTVQGLCKYDRFSANFVTAHPALLTDELKDASVQAFLEDQAGQFWIGTNKGLAHFDPVSGQIAIYRSDPTRADSLSETSVYTIYQDSLGRIWITGGINELNLYLPARQRFKKYSILAEGRNRTVFKIYEDKQGRLLVGSWLNGLQQYDATTDSFVPFQPAGLPQWVGQDTLISACEEQSGQLWLGLYFGGVLRYDPALDRWVNYRHQAANSKSLSDDRFAQLLIDSSGHVWVATANGLNRFEPQTESFTRYTMREGLPDNNINSMQEDTLGRLWLGTDQGLARFDPQTGAVRVYDVSDGLPSNRFYNRAALRTRNGELFFGTMRGLMHFNPNLIEEHPSALNLVLTEVRKFEQPFPFGPMVSSLAALDFTWRDGLLTFEFAALGLRQPQKAQYAWKLDGYDSDWILGGTKRTATYTNLPGGHYTLRVKATDETGRWHEKELAVQVNVSAPPWKRWWAYLLYGLALAGAILGYGRYRINHLHTINEARTQFAQQLITSQEAERQRIAAELHDGLGQSLLVIKNRTIIGKKLATDGERMQAQFDEISKATGQALEEVRSIAYNLRPYHLERLGLRESIEAMIEKIRTATELEINARVALFDEVFSKDDEITFYRVIQECLNNIIKHAHATIVEINIVQTERQVTARIQDNGRGFVAASENQSSGFGLIGLSERVRMLGGTHSIASEAGKGTTVTVIITMKAE